MKMIIDELVTLLGLELAPGVLPKLQKFEAMIGSVVKTVGYASTALLGAASGAAYFAERMNQTSSNMARMGKLTGLNTDQLQELAFAAQLAGGNVDDMTQDIARMQESMNSPIPGQYNHSLFMMLGLEGAKSKSAIEVMDKINQFMNSKAWTQQEKMQWGKSLGLSDSALMLVTKTTAEYQKLREQSKKTGFFLSQKDLDNALKFTTQVNVLKEVIDALGKRVSSVAAPAMEKLTGDFIAWLGVNKEWIELGLQYVMEGIIGGFTRFGELLGATKGKLSEFSAVLKDSFPDYREFIKVLERTNIVTWAVYAALVALSGILLGMVAGLIAAHPYIAVLSIAITALAANWDKVTTSYNVFIDRLKSTWKEATGWIDNLMGFGAKGENYNSKYDSNEEAMANIFRAKGWSPPQVSKPPQPNNITINQTISGDSSFDIGQEVKRKTLDALSQTSGSGMLVPTVN